MYSYEVDQLLKEEGYTEEDDYNLRDFTDTKMNELMNEGGNEGRDDLIRAGLCASRLVDYTDLHFGEGLGLGLESDR